MGTFHVRLQQCFDNVGNNHEIIWKNPNTFENILKFLESYGECRITNNYNKKYKTIISNTISIVDA